MSREIVERARSLVGARFRAQGRSAATGFDCVGVVLHACSLPAYWGRANYRLRGDHANELRAVLARQFHELGGNSAEAGDALLMRVAPEQVHLAVWCGQSFVHADAAIGRVVETPGPPSWPVISVHRLRRSEESDSWQP